MAKKSLFEEGDIFSIPLTFPFIKLGNVLGVLARKNINEKSVNGFFLGYFFQKVYKELSPHIEETLKPSSAIKICRVFDQSLKEGKWPIVGKVANWSRNDWPLLPFVRRDILHDGIAWRVTYSEDDVSKLIGEISEPWDSTLEPDRLYSSDALEDVLADMLFYRDGTPK